MALKKKKQTELHIAVVMNRGTRSGRPHGDWACFVDADKDKAITAAIKARNAWGKYEILVGTLTEAVAVPVDYKTIKLAGLL